jgi:1,4-alpha-glucan branching enzyme
MPIQEFDGNDSWGYNPCYYFAADKAYGTEEAYKKLLISDMSRCRRIDKK